jgi:hypothetical protein
LTEFLNYVRVVAATNDGGRWVVHANGVEQWFEESEWYGARRIRDRFTSEMLERYCRALDLELFDPDAYGPRSVLVRSDAEVPSAGYVMSLDAVQEWLGFR